MWNKKAKGLAGVAAEVNQHICLCQARIWLRNPDETSPEVQNIKLPHKMDLCPPIFFKKKYTIA